MTRRTREFGIRLAVGAKRPDILRLVLGEGLRLTAIGAGFGLLAALGLTQMLRSLLYGVSPFDPLTFAAVPLLLVSIAFTACWFPAHRAARIDPLAALRYE